MKRKVSSLALMFMSMALTLHLTDRVARCSQEQAPTAKTAVAERCLGWTQRTLPSAGLGALVECEPQGIRLVSLLPGHANEKAGLKLGDRIVAIDGEPTFGCDRAWAVSQLRGKIGSQIALDVERGEGIWQRRFRVNLQRTLIDQEHSVYSRLRDGELVIRVLWLGPETSEQVVEHLAQMEGNDVDELVLDLTNLSQGDRDSLEAVAGLFLPENTKIGFWGDRELSTTGYRYTDRLTKVLVGKYTARYGEVLAHSLVNELDVEVEGETTAGLGTLGARTIRSRAAASKRDQLRDKHGRSIEGHPLEPSFWNWSSLRKPVASGLE